MYRQCTDDPVICFHKSFFFFAFHAFILFGVRFFFMSLATLLFSPLPSPHCSPWHFLVTSWTHTLYPLPQQRCNSSATPIYPHSKPGKSCSLFRSPHTPFRPHPALTLPALSFTSCSLIVKSTLYCFEFPPFLLCQQSVLSLVILPS